MPFKIVQTIEEEEIVLTIVPAIWEKDGILYWPTKKSILTKIQKNENLHPDTKCWQKMMCVMKRYLQSYEEAQREIEAMASNGDTDQEDSEKNRENAKEDCENMDDLPEVLPAKGLNRNKRSKKSSTPMSQLMDFNNEVLIADNSLTNVIFSDTILDANLGHTEDNTLVLNPGPPSASEEQTKKLDMVLENQQLLFEQMIKVQVTMETLAKTISNNIILPLNSGEPPAELLHKNSFKREAVSSEEELKTFEEKLSNADFFKETIENMTSVCGTSGKDNGIDCCYKLIDCFLTRDFVTKCSWTGNSRLENNKKVALKFFVNFRRLFLCIVRLADKDFCEAESDKFFKRIIKNSQQRKLSKISSTHKRRPKSSTYNSNNNAPKNNDKCEENNENNDDHISTDVSDDGLSDEKSS